MLGDIFKNVIRNYRRSTWLGKLLRLFSLALMIVVSGGLLLVTAVWIGVFGRIPDKAELARIQNPVASEVYSADSVLLGRFFLEERSPAVASELPKNLKDALIATEDIRFYEHGGIDFRSLARVIFKTILLQDESSGGGSTITQQLAKNLYPRRRHAFLSLAINKIRELIIARRLENIYSKDEILLLYLNTIPFSDNTYGVKTAANRFFSKSVSELSADESAVLVGMLKATHSYNPRLFPERALRRRNVVIGQMEKYGFLEQRERDRLQAKELELRYNSTDYDAGSAAYFRAHIRQELLTWCREHRNDMGEPFNLYTDGLRIYTTIDSRLQSYAEKAVRQEMKRIQGLFDAQLSARAVDQVVDAKVRKLDRYEALEKEGLSHEQILKRLDEPVKTRVFTWDGDKELQQSLIDSLRHHVRFLQTGVVAMSPADGAVRVWVGGIDHRYFKYDHVRRTTKRQVGSTIKPLLYAAALESGIGPCEYISARRTSYTNLDGWTPGNTDEETYEKKYSMEGGLAGSINTVSVKLLEKTGIHTAIGTLRAMGIESELPAVPSLALGTPSISMMEMVTAYSSLANGGSSVAPYYMTAITDQEGNVLERFEPGKLNGERAISAESSRMIVHMLQTVVSDGTGSALRSRYGLRNDLAGKTGTTQSNVDGWFIAMMPELVVGAWVGSDDPRLHFRSTALGQGASTALPIVGRFLQFANADQSLHQLLNATFPPLTDELERKLDCRTSKSNRNIFDRIFKRKAKGTREKDFKGD